MPEPLDRDERTYQMIEEALARLAAGERPDSHVLESRYPDLGDTLPGLLEMICEVDSVLELWRSSPTPDSLDGQTTSEIKAKTASTREVLPEKIGRYRIIKRIGAGGMGTVYQAHDPQLDRLVAIKLPHWQISPDHLRIYVQRFLREARAAARVRHPHICPIHDVGEHEGRPFVVMAFVDGQSLSDLLHARPRAFQDPATAVRLICQVLEALEEVHAHGIIHRDLKPGNILIDREGRALVSDFGLARLEEDPEKLSVEGDLVGTPAYMPMEQAAGRLTRIGPWSDLYSLGVVLYRLVTFRLPFKGGVLAEMIWKLGNETPPAPSSLRPGLDPALEAIIMKAMARNLEDRFQSARAFRQTLEEWLSGKSTVILPGTVASKSKISDSRTPTSARETPREPRSLLTIPSSLDEVTTSMSPEPARWSWRKSGIVTAVLAVVALVVVAVNLFMTTKNPEGPFHPELQMRKPKPVEPGEPLSPLALVRYPAPLQGLRSWDLELNRHQGYIRALAYSPDGRQLASAGHDGTIRIWESDTLKLLRILLVHTQVVYSLAWSPDGKSLASGGLDNSVRVWDIEQGQAIYSLDGYLDPVYGVAWSPRGDKLASIDGNGTVAIWQAATAKTLHTIHDHSKTGYAVAWSRDGKILASGGADYTIHLHDGETGKPLHALAGHTAVIGSLTWLGQSMYLASGDYGGHIRVWNGETGEERLVFRAPQQNVTALASGPDGKFLASGCAGGEIDLWDTDTGNLVQSFHVGKGGGVLGLTWKADNQTLASCSSASTIQLWRADKGQMLRELEGTGVFEYMGASWSEDGRILACPGKSWIQLWDADKALVRKILPEPGGLIFKLAWSPRDKVLASSDGKGRISMWKDGQATLTFGTPGAPQQNMAWSPDGKTLAASRAGSFTIELWKSATGQLAKSLVGHSGIIATLGWSPDSARLVSTGGAMDGSVRIWTVATGKDTTLVAGDTNHAGALAAWSPDGKTLASASRDQVQLWDGATLKPLRTIPSGNLFALAFSPDSKILATSGHDDNVRFWKVVTGESGPLLRPGRGPVYHLAWSPDAKTLATVGTDGMVRLWETTTGLALGYLFPGPAGEGLAVSKDGHFRCGPALEQDLVFLAQTEQGQQVLSPAEFTKIFGWHNDPDRVQMKGK